MRSAAELLPARSRSSILRRWTRYCAALAAIVLTAACNSPRSLTAAQRGEVVYRTNCVSCHNGDPNLPGPLGPPIAGSPYALVRARVLHAAYPPGYKPKRESHEMRPLPWLKGHVGDIAAYLKAAQDDR